MQTCKAGEQPDNPQACHSNQAQLPVGVNQMNNLHRYVSLFLHCKGQKRKKKQKNFFFLKREICVKETHPDHAFKYLLLIEGTQLLGPHLRTAVCVCEEDLVFELN